MENTIHQNAVQDVLQTLADLTFRLRTGDWIIICLVTAIVIFRAGDGKLWWKADPNAYMWYVAPQESGDFRSRQKTTRDIGERLQQTNNDIVILWGSQSGVSERFAERLSREWHSRFALKTFVADLDDYDPDTLSRFPEDKLAVFIMSTYGEGDPPDNAVNFYSGLEKMRKKGVKLNSLRYLAMGLGNKNYKRYNEVINVVDEILSSLGAQRIGQVGRADESQSTTEESFMDWKENVLDHLGAAITLEERPIVYEPNIDVLDVCVDDNLVYLGEPSEKELYGSTERVAYNARNPYAAPIALSRTLSSIPNRICAHMEFNLSTAPTLRYQTGDHLAVWPVNSDTEVTRLTTLLGLDQDTCKRSIMFDAKPQLASKFTLPSPTTRETLLKYYLEIGALASRDLLILLSQYAPTPAASTALLRLGKDKEAFRREVSARYLSLGKIMEMIEPSVPWSSVPFSLLIESFNRIQPRSYSISSSPLVQPRQPTITMVVNNKRVSSQDPSKKEDNFLGLATNFLLAHDKNLNKDTEALEPPTSQPDGLSYDLLGPRNKLAGSKVYMHLKRSSFKPPPNPVTPMIMVGAGTGIAPFRGFVQERARLHELGKPVGKMILFFGCRNGTEDFLYKDEWAKWKDGLGEKFELVSAFSRMAGQPKSYVQDALWDSKEVVNGLVKDEGAAFYICGAASMAREVRERLVEILAEANEQKKEEADRWVGGRMKKAGLYHEDVWG